MTQEISPLNSSLSVDYKSDTAQKVQNSSILTRIFKSVLARSTIGMIALYKGYIQPICYEQANPTTVLISSLAIGILFETAEENWLKKLLYEITIGGMIGWDTLNPSFQWVNEIIPSNESQGALDLGSQPLKNHDHHIVFQNWAILSMNEPYELKCQTLLTDPVSAEDWKIISPHREHKILACYDYYQVPTNLLIEAAKWIHAKRRKGINVLVHCKAGRGRSATVVVCYLLFLQILDESIKPPYEPHIQRTIQKVKIKRSFIASGSQIQLAAQSFLEAMKQEEEFYSSS